MRNIALKLMYNGTAYHGWQVQKNAVTVCGTLEKAIADGENLTDDCAAVERLGMPVTLTQGSRENIKITTPFDLLLGQAILENRVKGS